jgi:hypothetical protein
MLADPVGGGGEWETWISSSYGGGNVSPPNSEYNGNTGFDRGSVPL